MHGFRTTSLATPGCASLVGGWFGAISQNTTLQLRGLPAVTLLGGVRPTTILCDNTVAGGAVLYDAVWMTERAYSKDSGSSRAVFPAWLGVSAEGSGVPLIRDEAKRHIVGTFGHSSSRLESCFRHFLTVHLRTDRRTPQ